jgi:hypothetical protein
VDWEAAQFAGFVPNGGIFCDWIVEPDFINQNLTDPTLMATRWFGSFQNTFPTLGFAAAGIIAWNFVDPFLPPVECPDPISDGDFDWITRFVCTFTAATAVITISDSSQLVSQARRRLGNDSSLLLVISTEINLNFIVDARCLIKE